MISAITNPATVETTTPALKKRITIKEYVKSFVFLAAIYSLIINQVQHDKTDDQSTIKKVKSQQGNITEKKSGKQDLFFSLFYSGTSIILYPTHAWK